MSTLELRTATLQDLAFFSRLRRDAALQAQLLTVPASLDDAAITDWLQRRIAQPDSLFQVVQPAGGGAPLGYVQITQVHYRNGTAYGGIVLAPEARGQGYGRQALAAMTAQGQAQFGLRKLLAEIRHDNLASYHLHRNLGYQDVGRLRDHFRDANDECHDVWLLERLLPQA